MSTIVFEEVTVRYRDTRSATLLGVNLTIPVDRTVGLIGESGSGKSTLARAIVGLAPVTQGRLTVGGRVVAAGGRFLAPEIRREVQLVFQDATAALNPRMTVGAAIGEGVRISGERDMTKVARLLDLVGLPAAWAARYPHEMSGGQRQRVALARALAVQPRRLILDEATSALDVSVQASILNLLRQLREEIGVTYLVISHDLAVVRYLCEDVVVIHRGSIVERGSTREVFANPAHAYTRQLRDAVPTFHARARAAAIGAR